MTWAVGQKAIVVAGRTSGRGLIEVEITKVGRRWIHFGRDQRFDKDTGWVDAGVYSSESRAYRDLAHYQKQKARVLAVRTLQRVLDSHHIYRLEQSLTEAQVRAAVQALGIDDLFITYLPTTPEPETP